MSDEAPTTIQEVNVNVLEMTKLVDSLVKSLGIAVINQRAMILRIEALEQRPRQLSSGEAQ